MNTKGTFTEERFNHTINIRVGEDVSNETRMWVDVHGTRMHNGGQTLNLSTNDVDNLINFLTELREQM